MPWYKFYANHGPGHQSHTDRYYWCEKPFSPAEKESMWHDIFEGRMWPIGSVCMVKTLPEAEWKLQSHNAKAKISSGQQMLKVLAQTKITKSKFTPVKLLPLT